MIRTRVGGHRRQTPTAIADTGLALVVVSFVEQRREPDFRLRQGCPEPAQRPTDSAWRATAAFMQHQLYRQPSIIVGSFGRSIRSIRLCTTNAPMASSAGAPWSASGVTRRPATSPSKPVTATRPGTSTPASLRASMSANATSSLTHTKASAAHPGQSDLRPSLAGSPQSFHTRRWQQVAFAAPEVWQHATLLGMRQSVPFGRRLRSSRQTAGHADRARYEVLGQLAHAAGVVHAHPTQVVIEPEPVRSTTGKRAAMTAQVVVADRAREDRQTIYPTSDVGEHRLTVGAACASDHHGVPMPPTLLLDAALYFVLCTREIGESRRSGPPQVSLMHAGVRE